MDEKQQHELLEDAIKFLFAAGHGDGEEELANPDPSRDEMLDSLTRMLSAAVIAGSWHLPAPLASSPRMLAIVMLCTYERMREREEKIRQAYERVPPKRSRKNQESWNDLPQAHRVQVMWCEGPKCNRPHIVLFDEQDEPFAQFVWPTDPRPDGGSFLEDVQHAIYASQAQKED